jgi:hypothetical protein
MATDANELVVESMDHIKNKCAISDYLTQVAQGVGHGLELAAILRDGLVASAEGAELSVEVEGACFLVAEEICFNSEPSGARRGAAHHDGFDKVEGDGAEDPGAHDEIHPNPIRRLGEVSVGENVILDRVLA